ncbi:Acetylornithine/succinyldiaminopimelate aminotransferase [Sodalis praecaptivus]
MSSSHRYRQYYGEFADRAIMFPYANCGQCYYDKQPGECGSYCGKMISRAMENDFYGIASENSNEIGAFFLELCQGRGYTVLPKDFFRQFVPEMQKRGILIVDDEIQVGMFRTEKLFAFEHYDIVPDIITLGKSLTNGLSPLSAVWAREELVSRDIFTPGHAHSNFANHSLGTAAALQTWRYMIAQDYEPLLSQKSAYFMGGLRRLKQRHPFIGLIEGLGMLFSVTFTTPDGLLWRNAGKQAVTLAQDNDYVYQGETLRLILNSGGYHCEKSNWPPGWIWVMKKWSAC